VAPLSPGVARGAAPMGSPRFPFFPAVLRDEVERRGLPIVELPSGAGHDAGVLAVAGVESSMLFARSLNGAARQPAPPFRAAPAGRPQPLAGGALERRGRRVGGRRPDRRAPAARPAQVTTCYKDPGSRNASKPRRPARRAEQVTTCY